MARKLLSVRYGVRIIGYVIQVGDIVATVADPAKVTLADVEASIVRCPVPGVAEK